MSQKKIYRNLQKQNATLEKLLVNENEKKDIPHFTKCFDSPCAE